MQVFAGRDELLDQVGDQGFELGARELAGSNASARSHRR